MTDFSKLCDDIVNARKTVNEYTAQYKEAYEKSKENSIVKNSLPFRDFLNGVYFAEKNNIDITYLKSYSIENASSQIGTLTEAQNIKNVDILYKVSFLNGAESILYDKSTRTFLDDLTHNHEEGEKTIEKARYDRASESVFSFMPGKSFYIGGQVKENVIGEESIKPTHFFSISPFEDKQCEALGTHIGLEIKDYLTDTLTHINAQAKELKGKLDELNAINEEIDKDDTALE